MPPHSLPPGFELLDDRPLREPWLLLAFTGWSDGGDAASSAVRYLCDRWELAPVARMDAEAYFDFTVVRPQVRACEGGERRIHWPDQEFYALRSSDPAQPDLLLSFGEEPHLRWRTFARSLTDFISAMGVRRVVQLGAYLADVIYSQPTRVAMTSTDAEWVAAFDLRPPRYEGATGILTVMAESLRQAGTPSATLWAPIPHYVSTRPNPRGALALLERVEVVTERSLDLDGLCELAERFDNEVSQAISEDPELSAYVRELKRRAFSR